MLERNYDPRLPYRYLLYGRMSDPRQNKRSPDQQFNNCEETRQRCGYPWQLIRTYRDDGISGRLLRKRRGFQKMLRDIELGLIQIDLIVVDTYERFGRSEEIGYLRHKLFTDHGVLVVAADSGFSDPTGIVGKSVGMVEQVRATENTRVSRHNVLRGKIDAARLRHWPGGPAPFGLQMKPIVDNSTIPPTVYNILEPNPREAPLQLLAFQHAARTGYGAQRMSQWWNYNSEIPEEFKPISTTTMGDRLGNAIYIGTLVYGENCTGIVNDARVIEHNPNGAEVINNFCEPIVPTDTFEEVQQLRKARADKIRESRQKGKDESSAKLIAPQGRGLTLKYLLTGLVRCPCNASMRPIVSGRCGPAGKRYLYYACPRHLDGACENGIYAPEDQLREATIARIRERLFPAPGSEGGTPSWLPELIQLVQHDLKRLEEETPDQEAGMRRELQEIDRHLVGWRLTLGDPNLSTVVRSDLVTQFERAMLRKQELESEENGRRALKLHVEKTISANVVVENLQRLDETLAGFNPTLGNIELSKHIEKIVCFPDGKVELRGTRLGLFNGAVELLSRAGTECSASSQAAEAQGHGSIVPRLRSRLYVPNLSTDSAGIVGDLATAIDPDRFAGVPEKFFWKQAFVLEKKLPWAKTHAEIVFKRRQETRLSQRELANEFGVTGPTIGGAIRNYLETHPGETDNVKLGRGGKRKPKINVAAFASEALQLWRSGWSKVKLAAEYGCSTTVIDKALAWAYEQEGLILPTREGIAREKSTEARKLLDEGRSLQEIATSMHCTTVTARKLLKDSFAVESKVMPDLRSRCRVTGN
jgi:DNA invertase Pin-like site-specific DNA recombinase